jgi:hypothetical protein
MSDDISVCSCISMLTAIPKYVQFYKQTIISTPQFKTAITQIMKLLVLERNKRPLEVNNANKSYCVIELKSS